MTLHVEVTEEDIALGNPHDCKGCPIFLALRRVAPPSWSQFAVTGALIFYNTKEDFRFAPLPQEAVDFIVSFDRATRDHPFRSEMQPFSFSLEVG